MIVAERTTGMLIGGEETRSASGAEFESVDPATEEVIATSASGSQADVDRAVGAARDAFDRGGDWQTPRHRVGVLNRIVSLMRERSALLAELESRDTGMPISQGRASVVGAARFFEYYAGFTDKIDGRSIPMGPGYVAYTQREPLGVCAIITPWNAPLQVAARSVAAALASGNAVVVKPSREAPLSTVELGRIIAEAGVTPGYINVVTGSGEAVGMPLAIHPEVDSITFTGSVEVGKVIGEAGARLIRPVSLELGGKSPNIVFPDADIERVAPAVLSGIVGNAGQNCAAGSRLIVHRDVADALLRAVGRLMGSVTMGRGLDDPDMGPLISEKQRQKVVAMVEEARGAGARLVTGGEPPTGRGFEKGFFYRPTLLSDVSPTMRIARDEVFGPVLVALTFDTEDEAVALANDTEYGLTAHVWTRDIGRAHRVAGRVRSGQVWINSGGLGGGASAELPFGGFKYSGHGRVKGLEGLLEYTHVKNINVAL